jgi:hypothetical protein
MSIAQNTADIVMGAASTLTLATVDLGPVSENGVKITFEQTVMEHRNDQSFAPVAHSLLGRTAKITFELTESTLTRVLTALNLAAASLSASTLTIDDSIATAAQLIIAGPSPTGSGSATRTYTFPKVLHVGSTELMVSKNNEQKLAIEFTAQYDTDTSKIGTIVDAA